MNKGTIDHFFNWDLNVIFLSNYDSVFVSFGKMKVLYFFLIVFITFSELPLSVGSWFYMYSIIFHNKCNVLVNSKGSICRWSFLNKFSCLPSLLWRKILPFLTQLDSIFYRVIFKLSQSYLLYLYG